MEIYSLSGSNVEELKNQVRNHFAGWDVFIWEKSSDEGQAIIYGVPWHQVLDYLQGYANRIAQAIDPYASVRVSLEDKEKGRILVIIRSRRASLFIGWHGQTLDAIEGILVALLSHKLGVFVEVCVDTAQYRRKRESFLRALVKKIVAEVELDHKERPIPNLLPKERRLVHLMFQKHPYLTTESRGEADERTLYIMPRPDLTSKF